jgi:hypothetical protein
MYCSYSSVLVEFLVLSLLSVLMVLCDPASELLNSDELSLGLGDSAGGYGGPPKSSNPWVKLSVM